MSRAAAALWIGISIASPLHAGTPDPNEVVDWQFAAAFGTGVYRVEDKTTWVMQLPLSFSLRDREPGRWGWRLIAPITLGWTDSDLDVLLSTPIDETFGSLSALVGVELSRDFGPWTVAPFVAAGYGVEFSEYAGAWIWHAGTRARRRFEAGRFELAMGTEFSVAGYGAHHGPHQTLTRFGLGFDAQTPTSWIWRGRTLMLGGYVAGYAYVPELDFYLLDGAVVDVRLRGEVALTLGARPALDIFGFPLDRVGLAVGSGDGVATLRLVTRFPF